MPGTCDGEHVFREFKGLWENPQHFYKRRNRDSRGRFAVRKCSCSMPIQAGPKVQIERSGIGYKIVASAQYRCDHGEQVMYSAAQVTYEMVDAFNG